MHKFGREKDENDEIVKHGITICECMLKICTKTRKETTVHIGSEVENDEFKEDNEGEDEEGMASEEDGLMDSKERTQRRQSMRETMGPMKSIR